jgi:hypothetical protein
MLYADQHPALRITNLSNGQPLVHISYAPQDEAWVRGVVIPALGLSAGQYWTRTEDHLGAPKLEELERAVQSCRYTLLVASIAAQVDEWTAFAGLLAQHLSMEDGKPRLLIITRDFESASNRARLLLPLRHRCLTLLDCSDPERSASSLATLAAQLALATSQGPPIECPYPGLRTFGAGPPDSCFERIDLFFGRDEEGHEIIDKLSSHGHVLVVGPSGCGKSSLIHARVLPTLRHNMSDVIITVIRPGAHPDIALRTALDALHPDLNLATDLAPAVLHDTTSRCILRYTPPRITHLIYIDQFEEIFLNDSIAAQDSRTKFFALLSTLERTHGVATLLSMRADFYGDLMRSPTWETYKDHRVELAPLRGHALRQAITRPAACVGVHVETDLVERLVREAELDRAAEALPLLQVALEQLWSQREWRYLSLTSYTRIVEGERCGLDVILARHADATIGALDGEMQALARRVLIDLVHFGEGRPDTRRRRSIKELCRAGDDLNNVRRLLHHLLTRRLITTGIEARIIDERDLSIDPSFCSLQAARHIDLAHDTLITGWPALSKWIMVRRDKLRTQRRLEARAAGGGLLDSAELPEFSQWIAWVNTQEGQEYGVSEELRSLVRRSVSARIRLMTGLIAIIIVLAMTAGIAYWQRSMAIDNARLAEQRARDADVANRAAQEESQRATQEAEQTKSEQAARALAEAEARTRVTEAETALAKVKQANRHAERASAKAREADARAEEAARAERAAKAENEVNRQKELRQIEQRDEASNKITTELP